MRTVYKELLDVEAHHLKSEDSGHALLLNDIGGTELEGDSSMFVRIQSWDDTKEHPLLNSLVGKKIRITIEVED